MIESTTSSLESLRESRSRIYPALLFLSEKVREDVATLYAFHFEIERISYLVSEPMPGEIRLQWWREVIGGIEGPDRSGEGAANPLAKSLLRVIGAHNLPYEGFQRYLDARVFDLYNDAMPDRNTMEAYFGETESFILQMSVAVCGIETDSRSADACGHGGVATGIARKLELAERDRNLQKTWLPMDLLNSAGLTREEWFLETGSRHEMAVSAFAALGNEHFSQARTAIAGLPRHARSAFLPLAMFGRVLRSTVDSKTVLQDGLRASPIGDHFALWKTVLLGW